MVKIEKTVKKLIIAAILGNVLVLATCIYAMGEEASFAEVSDTSTSVAADQPSPSQPFVVRCEPIGEPRTMADTSTKAEEETKESQAVTAPPTNAEQYELVKALLLKSTTDYSKSLLANYIIKHGTVDAQDQYGCTLLINAAQYDDLDLVTSLLEKNAHVNATNFQGQTPLTYACRYNFKTEVVHLLLNRKANINAKTDKALTPLMRACEGGNTADIVKTLLDRGALVHPEDAWHNTALTWTLSDFSCIPNTQMLVLAGANCDIGLFHKCPTYSPKEILAAQHKKKFMMIRSNKQAKNMAPIPAKNRTHLC